LDFLSVRRGTLDTTPEKPNTSTSPHAVGFLIRLSQHDAGAEVLTRHQRNQILRRRLMRLDFLSVFLRGMAADKRYDEKQGAPSPQKHILFIVENATVPLDVRVWAEALAAKEWGYETTVLCPKAREYTKSFETIQGIKIYRHPRFSAGGKTFSFIVEYISALFWEIFFSFRIYMKTPFHLIHGANPPDHLFLVAGLLKPFGVKFLFDHHDLSPETYVAKFKRKGLFHNLLLLLEKINFKVADAVVSTNESYKSIAIHRGGKDPRNVFVVRNGPRLDSIHYPQPNPGRWKNGFRYLVAYIGVIGTQDQLDVLLRIVDCIVMKRKVFFIKFIVIGDGPNKAEIVRMAEEMNLKKYIEFTGFVPYGPDLFEILTTADVCINPEFKNDYTDKSTMIKIMEYMSFGKPIIQFDSKEGKVSAGEASIYIKENNELLFADRLIELLQDEGRKKRMAEAGRQRVRDLLQWDIQKLELREAYRSLFS
jgi:glycosyltransferase involved in cell wall biosynthesis